jgi:hypothetical protein
MMSIKGLLVRVLAVLVGGGGCIGGALLGHSLWRFDHLVSSASGVTVALALLIVALYLALVEVD